MIKKLTLGTLVTLMVLFSGCSQKEVEVTEEASSTSATSEKKADTQDGTSGEKMAQESASSQTASVEKDEMKSVPNLNNIYFDYDKYVIKSEMRPVLSNNYKKLKDSGYDKTITIEGHCDNRGTTEYNFALGLKRASTVKSELIEYGVNPSSIKTISYGENKPLCTAQNEECWSKNRRVITVLER